MPLDEGLRKVPALLARGWIELMGGNRQPALADAHRAAATARQRRDDLGLAEAITLAVLSSSDPATETTSLREAIEIWQETGCRLEEAATRVVAARLGAHIPGLDGHLAGQLLEDHGINVESRRTAGPLGAVVRAAPAVSIQTLGVFQVIRERTPVATIEWKSKKARDLLKILIARRRPTPRDQLLELLWPEVDPAVGSNRLSVLLAAVRDVLAPPPAAVSPLVTTGGAVSLNHTRLKVDVEEFLNQAAVALAAHRADEADATARLVAAIAAHTGDFLEDDPYQEWAVPLAEEVRATHIALLRALVTRLREAGDIDTFVRYTLRLLEQDCYDEEAHLTLLGVLLDAGRLGVPVSSTRPRSRTTMRSASRTVDSRCETTTVIAPWSAACRAVRVSWENSSCSLAASRLAVQQWLAAHVRAHQRELLPLPVRQVHPVERRAELGGQVLPSSNPPNPAFPEQGRA